MQDAVAKLKTLIKAQSAIARIELQAKETQIVYGSLALVAGLLGFGMLNAAAFLGLRPVLGGAWSALILGILDIALAIWLGRTSMHAKPGPEAAAARELRDYVVGSFESEAERLQTSLHAYQTDLAKVRSTLSTVASGASTLLPSMSAVVTLLTTALKKTAKRKTPEKEDEAPS